MTEFHQKFKEKNLDAPIDDDYSSTSSGFGSFSNEATYDLSDSSWSCSLPEFRSDTGTISPKPQYSVNYIMGPICEETIRNALRNLRPVPHPKDFAAEPCRPPSPVASPSSSPRTMTSFTTIEDLRIAHDKEIRNIEDSKHSVEDYLQSVDFEDVTNEGQQSNIQATPIPCPENIYGWQTGSYLNGGLRRHTDCIDLDTDMTDRFIVELKPRKKKRGLLSRLRFWMQQSKSSQDVSGIGSDEINKDNKRCGGWKLFCCCKSTVE